MIDQVFFEHLEYQITKAFEYSNNKETKGFWCDGVTRSEPDSHYLQKMVNANKHIKLKTFIGRDGQSEYELVLKIGKKALSKYARNLRIEECVPSPDKENWFNIDTNRRKIEIQLD